MLLAVLEDTWFRPLNIKLVDHTANENSFTFTFLNTFIDTPYLGSNFNIFIDILPRLQALILYLSLDAHSYRLC